MPDRLMFYYTVATSPFLLYLSGNISQWSNSVQALLSRWTVGAHCVQVEMEILQECVSEQ